MNYLNSILDIINSPDFKNELSKINNMYSNLKQETLIRNLLLEKLNAFFALSGLSHLKAFAEHPRLKGMRIDMSIINSKNLEETYKIEFKYQFSKDANNLKDYWKIINKDFEIRISDLFILIVTDWNKEDKSSFDNNWGITSNLSRYTASDESWKVNILQSFAKFENSELKECERIKVSQPYLTNYYFYILSRK